MSIYKRKSPKKINCSVCNIEFLSSYNGKYCGIVCQRSAHKRYRKKPDAPTWISIVEYINERDGYKCTSCGNDEKIIVHHIKYLCNGGGNETSNLVTLCTKCHIKVHQLVP